MKRGFVVTYLVFKGFFLSNHSMVQQKNN